MAKKKDKPQVINNIGELNLEADYDKLAEAIVKASNKEKQQSEKKSFVSNSFAFWISLVFRFVPLFGIAASAFGLFALFKYATSVAAWNTGYNIIANVLVLCLVGLILLAVIGYCIIMWRAAKEIEQEKDKNFIVAVFSGIVSFAALIVALVAIFKGVG